MSLTFSELGYDRRLREGFLPMGSTERTALRFEDAIRSAVASLANAQTHEIASWIVARLAYLTAGALEIEGSEFSYDTNEIGYKLRATNPQTKNSAHGAIVIADDRIYFSYVDVGIGDFQSVVVEMLSRYPDDLTECSIRVCVPESKRSRLYGWDGYSLHR